jgi:preprotein translocase subunit YajC
MSCDTQNQLISRYKVGDIVTHKAGIEVKVLAIETDEYKRPYYIVIANNHTFNANEWDIA